MRQSNNTMSDLNVRQLLGHGTYDDVYMCTKKQDTKKVEYALKILDVAKLKNKIKHTPYVQVIATEIIALVTCNHPNIVKMYEWFCDDKSVYFLMEYTPLTDLYSYTNNFTIPISPRRIISYMRQLWNCMIFLRERSIIHRDIKPENRLVIDNGETIKLSDFGMSYIINDGIKPSGMIVGTMYYIAPEIILEKEHYYTSDLWASGMLFYEMLTGIILYDYLENDDDVMNAIVKNDYELTIAINSQFNMECICLIKEILKSDPDDRPSLEQCLLFLNKCECVVNYVYPNMSQYYMYGEYEYKKYNTL